MAEQPWQDEMKSGNKRHLVGMEWRVGKEESQQNGQVVVKEFS